MGLSYRLYSRDKSGLSWEPNLITHTLKRRGLSLAGGKKRCGSRWLQRARKCETDSV